MQKMCLALLLLTLAGCQANSLTPSPTAVASIVQTHESPTVSAAFSGKGDRATAVTLQSAAADPETAVGPAGAFVIQIDAAQNVQPISPLIYGLSDVNEAILADLRPTLISWGGNPSTRYNWQHGRAWNAGSDWFYRNGNYGYTGESAADDFVASANDAGVTVRMALPTLGWVAKNDDNDTCSFPLADGSCGNGQGSSCDNPVQIADPTLANVPSDPDFVTDWVQHLVDDADFDIRFFAMDNEPELWGYTHYDVHPECTTYAEILETYLAYATAVRGAAPDAELTGPVTCCWYFYWNSAAGAADKAAHGSADFLPWFLGRVRAHDEANGVRTLDVLDLHFYPEGVYNSSVDAETAALRLRSTRALWDPAYVDESWINEPVTLIPRMQQLIADHYPGTKLGLSEWNWGADETMNGALAIADVLGIFGREGLYFAAYWRAPAAGSPGFQAFKMYTNYDGSGGRFGDVSVQARTADVTMVSSFAALDADSGDLHIMLINKQPQTAVAAQIQLANFTPGETAIAYQLADDDRQITSQSLTGIGTSFSISLPPYSITHLVIPAGNE